jgi:hypothetical protein
MVMPRTEAEMRAIGKAGLDYHMESWDEASWFIDHTLIGRGYVLRECWADVVKELRAALPTRLRRWLHA